MTGPLTGARGRVAVIGDVGGHLGELQAELARLGADATAGRLPDDLVVVQVGDLIHRGPDSAGVLRLVDHYLQTQPEQWIQLVGNHEAQYLREPAFDWPERLDAEAAAILNRWWRDGQLVVACAVRSVGGDGSSGSAGEAGNAGGGGDQRSEPFLITHAGLTRAFWREVLDRLTDADRVAAALNSLIGSHEDVLFHAGQMLGGARPDALAGPVWAAAGTELVPGWLGVRLPFSQIHGHSSLSAAGAGVGRSAAAEIRRRTTVDAAARHEVTVLDGGRIVGVDPGHGKQPRRPWRSWLIVTSPRPG